jgi:REP element-mobilizing transposase RayT
MGNDPRWIPPRALVEVTQKAIHGRFLLRPSRDLVDIFNGVLIRAAQRYAVKVCAFTCLSNHSHMLVVPEDCEALSAFMGYFAGNLAKEVGRLHDWRQKLFGRRYSHVVLSEEPEAQEQRLRYLLSNGCKEGLVERPEDWPGPSSTEALLTGRTVRGVWFDRSSEYEARRCNHSFSKYEFAEVHDLELAPIPAWAHLGSDERRARAQQMVREIAAETRARAEESGRSPLGIRRVLRQNPHDKPAKTHSSPKPIVHAASRRVRRAMKIEFYLFRRAYREASEALRAGDFNVEFPPGSHRPRLPFVTGRPPPSRN